MSDIKKKDPIQGEIIHEYDGIEEADNGIPHWLSIIFYGAMAFAILYWFYYHEYEVGMQPGERYAAQMAEQAGGGGEVSADALIAMSEDPDAVAKGQQLYETNCVQCHGPDGGGKIGPNLTDPYWIHGGGPSDIYATIHDGVLDKGMPSWSGPLGPEGVEQAAAYVLTLRGKNVEGGKEPQGEKWTGGEGAETAEAGGAADAGAAEAAEAGDEAADAGAAAAQGEEPAGDGVSTDTE